MPNNKSPKVKIEAAIPTELLTALREDAEADGREPNTAAMLRYAISRYLHYKRNHAKTSPADSLPSFMMDTQRNMHSALNSQALEALNTITDLQIKSEFVGILQALAEKTQAQAAEKKSLLRNLIQMVGLDDKENRGLCLLN
ncbi:MAG: hypothetical protein GY862_33210 [Gammaproteobacteria bacterium]|nr:hypothetical protein [Gammaproteobacteria bacterium]